jgi:phosphate:Na+ symporter
VDERLLTTPPIAIMQVKKEVEYMADLAKENLEKSFTAMEKDAKAYETEIAEREKAINFTNKALTRFLIKLSPLVDGKNEKRIGAYFHVLNDLERIGDHAENFGEIGTEMQGKELAFSVEASRELQEMKEKVLHMFAVAVEIFDDADKSRLSELTALENEVDGLKRELTTRHYARLAEGNCSVELSPYFSSTVARLERVADHLVNVGYSIVNPTGSQSEVKI